MDAEDRAMELGTHEGQWTIRPTQAEALANVLAVLHLCGAGKLRCSEKTQRPTAATVSAVAEVLAGGDFYPAEPIAAFAWPRGQRTTNALTSAKTRRHLAVAVDREPEFRRALRTLGYIFPPDTPA
jgi:hypothetical protein